MIKFYPKRGLEFCEALKKAARNHDAFFQTYDFIFSFDNSSIMQKVFVCMRYREKKGLSDFKNVEDDLRSFALDWIKTSYDAKNDCSVYKADVTPLFLPEQR